jgi:hypothetical protein
MDTEYADNPNAQAQRKHVAGVKSDLKEIKKLVAEELPEIREMLNQLLSHIVAQQQQPSAPNDLSHNFMGNSHGRTYRVPSR